MCEDRAAKGKTHVVNTAAPGRTLPPPPPLCRSECGGGHVGALQPLPDGHGGRLHHHVSQQRDPLLPEARSRLLHPLR